MTSNTEKSQRRTARIDQCRICGDTAYYSYFGVLSCQTCKMFFKRYGNMKKNPFVCSNDRQCVITKESRHLCRACRLDKCFRVGMQRERIRQGNFKKQSQRRNFTDAEIPKSVGFDNLTRLNDEERVFMKNICHFYDISPLFQLAHSIKSGPATNFEQSIEKLIHLLYENAGRSFRNLTNFHPLSYGDRSVLLHSSGENVIYLASVYLFGQSMLIDHRPTMAYLKNVYGSRSFSYFQRIVQLSRFDLIPFQLATLLCSISNNALIFHSTLNEEYEDIRSILDLEKKVVHIVWNYFVENYSFYQAVRRYFKVIELLMIINVGIATVRNTDKHLNDFESFVERTELNFFVDDLDRSDNVTFEHQND